MYFRIRLAVTKKAALPRGTRCSSRFSRSILRRRSPRLVRRTDKNDADGRLVPLDRAPGFHLLAGAKQAGDLRRRAGAFQIRVHRRGGAGWNSILDLDGVTANVSGIP